MPSNRGGTSTGFFQISPDLVVKSQPTEFIDIIPYPIKLQNGVHMACSVRKSRGKLLLTPEAQ
jgi:hypothetical protein